MSISRRNFLKLAGSSALLGTVGTVEARPNKEPSPDAVGMLYDATLCIGCKACMVGCKVANGMPVEDTLAIPGEPVIWDAPVDISDKTLNIIKVYKQGTAEVKDREFDGFSFIKRHCMHCVDASCVSVCPTNAMRKDPVTGVVNYHPEVCIGCRYCAFACPYNVPAYEFNNPFGQIHKCQFCDHRLKQGQLPGCVESCPTGASLFGTRKEIQEEANRRLSMRPGEEYAYPVNTVNSPHKHVATVKQYQKHLYGEQEGGGTQVMMLAAVPFDKLGLPNLPEKSAASRSETVQHSVYQGFMAPSLLLLFLLYITSKTVRRVQKGEESQQLEEE
jgi:Fe-S-cluster-containing dehydrogenase component